MRSDLGIQLLDIFPVDQAVDERLQIVGAAIAVVDVVGVLPDVDAEDRRGAVHQRVLAVRGLGDLELATLDRKPNRGFRGKIERLGPVNMMAIEQHDELETRHAFLTGERTQEGFYRVKNGLEQSISRGVAYAPYADLVWCETGTPDLGFAREFAQAIHAKYPGKLLSYNCSPSFNWKKNLNDKQIATFQDELSALGYKYQFITLAGIHINWYNTFQFAHAYANGEGMKHYVNMVQEPEFAARDKGYTFVSHQQEVGAGYFDDVTTVIQGGSSSVKALSGSTEEEQFH